MKTINATLIIACILLSVAVEAQQLTWSRVEIFASPKEIQARAGLNLDHGYYNFETSSFTTDLNNNEIAKLVRGNVPFTTKIADVKADFKEKNARVGFYDHAHDPVRMPANIAGRQNFESPCGPQYTSLPTPTLFTMGSMGGYYTLSEINAKIDELVTTYGDSLVQKINLGTVPSSPSNLTVWGIKISKNCAVDEDEPEILYTALVHAREPMGMMNMFYYIHYLLQYRNSNTNLRNILDSRELFFIPCANPQGYLYNESIDPGGGGMQRKNRRNTGGEPRGVDINRNFSVDFGYDNIGSSSTTTDEDYRGGPLASGGGVPYTEPESVIIRDFCRARRFTVQVDNHCYGNYLSLPYGVSANHPMTTEELNFYSYAPAQLAKYNCFKAGTSIQTVGYQTNGTAKDYYIAGDLTGFNKGKIFSFTSEAGDASDGFWPLQSRIIPIAKEMLFQNIQLALIGGAYVDLQDATDMAVNPGAGIYNVNLNFTVRRVGLTNRNVRVSVIPLENIRTVNNVVDIDSTIHLQNYFDTYNGAINIDLYPSITAGQRFKFIWKVETEGVVTMQDTVVKYYNPEVMFTDNMDAGTFTTNWANSTGGTWNYSNFTGAVSGTRALAESPGTRYSASSNFSARIRPAFNLAATGGAKAAYLTFWVRNDAQNCFDNLQVQAAGNYNPTTGAGTFVNLCGKNTVAEADGTLGGSPALTGKREFWTKEVIDLKDFLTSTSVGIRFLFTSNSDTVRGDGYFIDDVRVIRTTATFVNLPTVFTDIRARLMVDKSVEVTWAAEIDPRHSHFIVEKSTDGSRFVEMEQVTTRPYISFDRHPSIGKNYYRIKAVDLDGRFLYSRMVKVDYNPSMFSFVLFPNPVKDKLTLQINTPEVDVYSVQVSDLLGRTLYTKSVSINAAGEEVIINTAKWKQGVYMLKVINSRNEVMTTQKFVKD